MSKGEEGVFFGLFQGRGFDRAQRWCFDVELLLLALKTRTPVSEVAVKWTEISGSKIQVTTPIHMTYEIVLLIAGETSLPSQAVRSCDHRNGVTRPRTDPLPLVASTATCGGCAVATSSDLHLWDVPL